MNKAQKLLEISEAVPDKMDKISMKNLLELAFTRCMREPDGTVQCHYSVGTIQRGLDRFNNFRNWKNFIIFVNWDELWWDRIGKRIEKDQAWKLVTNKHAKNLLRDIADGSVNGHSFIKYKDWYVDPYLSSLRVPFKQIQKIDSYLWKIYPNSMKHKYKVND